MFSRKLRDNPFVKILKIKKINREIYHSKEKITENFVLIEFYDKTQGWINLNDLDKKSFIAKVLLNTNEVYVVKTKMDQSTNLNLRQIQ